MGSIWDFFVNLGRRLADLKKLVWFQFGSISTTLQRLSVCSRVSHECLLILYQSQKPQMFEHVMWHHIPFVKEARLWAEICGMRAIWSLKTSYKLRFLMVFNTWFMEVPFSRRSQWPNPCQSWSWSAHTFAEPVAKSDGLSKPLFIIPSPIYLNTPEWSQICENM